MQMDDQGVTRNRNFYYKYRESHGGYEECQKNHILMSAAKCYPSPTPSFGLIEHPVSRFDTLAGVAIKYGVEVADIKKINGLVTDLQMFALKSLQIPSPGRHPPSSCLSNGHHNAPRLKDCGHSLCKSAGGGGMLNNGIRKDAVHEIPTYHRYSDIFDSFQSLKLNSSQRRASPAMSCLQGYYGLETVPDSKTPLGVEMLDNGNGDSNHQCLGYFPALNTPLKSHRSLLEENAGPGDNQLYVEADSEKRAEKLVRRRQKSEADFASMLMREDSCGAVSTAITGKSLALRSKAASRPVLRIDSEMSDCSTSGGLTSVRKSSSTSSLQDQDGRGASLWTSWSLKPDLPGFSAATIPRPIFDGLPKPISSRRNKAALD